MCGCIFLQIGIQMTHLESATSFSNSIPPSSATTGCRSIREFATGTVSTTVTKSTAKAGSVRLQQSDSSDGTKTATKTIQPKITAAATSASDTRSNLKSVCGFGLTSGIELSEAGAALVVPPSRTSAFGAPPPLPLLPKEYLDDAGAEEGHRGGRSSPSEGDKFLPSASQVA